MNIGRLRLLLAAWVVFVIVPGVVATIALDLDADSSIGGGAVGIWIGGYLVQLGLFMAVSRISSRTNALAWFVASLLPWACDWSTPVRLWAVAPCAAVAVATAWLVHHTSAGDDALVRHGIRATGVVVEVVKPMWNVVINNVYIRRTLRVRVERADGVAAYEARLKSLFMLGEVPSQGDRLALRVDPKNPQRMKIVDASDGEADDASAAADEPLPPPSSFRMHHTLSVDHSAGADHSAQADHAPSADGGLADELDKLARLHASGGLSDDEFAQAKARILGS